MKLNAKTKDVKIYSKLKKLAYLVLIILTIVLISTIVYSIYFTSDSIPQADFISSEETITLLPVIRPPATTIVNHAVIEETNKSPSHKIIYRAITPTISKPKLKIRKNIEPLPPLEPDIYWSQLNNHLINLEQKRVKILKKVIPKLILKPVSKTVKLPATINTAELIPEIIITEEIIILPKEITWSMISGKLLQLEQHRKQVIITLNGKTED
ncbi:MAG: hypothetical protein KAH84_12575 [Thiomargarita sp.]|nr:hypothetical protein [Thiomargarita sp.]